MSKAIDWERRIGRRLRLRDLHVFFAVVQSGSMAKAAAHLGITQPSVSAAIRDLEAALNVRLFDRGPQGVEPTVYGGALLKCGLAAFDDLKQGIKSIEFLSDPDTGEVRIGSSEAVMAGCIPAIIDRLARRYPRIVIHTMEGIGSSLRVALRERRIDLVVARSLPTLEEDLVAEQLFRDQLLVVAGIENRWARRRRIDLSELVDESWVLPTPDSRIGILISESFRSRGLALPSLCIASNSMILRSRLLATGRYISVLPTSFLHFGGEQPRLKVLPVTLPGIVPVTQIEKLKNRTLSPAVDRFIECARAVGRSMAVSPKPASSRAVLP
jgi:DNA-binding transcriptional LysR family regulator